MSRFSLCQWTTLTHDHTDCENMAQQHAEHKSVFVFAISISLIISLFTNNLFSSTIDTWCIGALTVQGAGGGEEVVSGESVSQPWRYRGTPLLSSTLVACSAIREPQTRTHMAFLFNHLWELDLMWEPDLTRKYPAHKYWHPRFTEKYMFKTTQALCCCCVPLVRPILLHGDMRWLSDVMLTHCQGRYSGETSHSAIQASLESPLISAFIHLFYQTELLSTWTTMKM